MRVLFLPAYYSPERAASSYLGDDLREALCASGAEVVLYTPVPSRGVSDDIRKEYKSKERRHEVLNDGKLHVNRFRLIRENRNPVSRFFRYVLCWFKQFNRGLGAKGIDCIYLASTPPIQGLLGAFLKRLKKVPFVYNLQDIFPDSLVGAGLARKGGILWKIGRIVEDFTYRSADKIIVISEDFKKNIISKGVPEDKIVVVYNWVDERAVKSVARQDNKLFDKYNLDRSKFYITYCGNLGLSQNLQLLVEVARELKKIDDIQFVLIGEGAYLDRLNELIVKDNVNNIRILPFQPYEDIDHVFSLGDVGLVISKPGIGSASVPSKTWSILSASRPVLANFDENELKSIIENNKCGLFTKAGDKEALLAAIMKLYNDRELCQVYGRNGRRFILENLTKEIGTKKYVDVINHVVSVT